MLREVKEVAENHVGEEVNRAVITVPAYYSEQQRAAVRRAGALAGLHVERILNEPTAAARWPTPAAGTSRSGCWSTTWAAAPSTPRSSS